MAEALRLADELDDIHTTHVARNAAAELRRLHELLEAEQTLHQRVIYPELQRLRAQRDALHQANEAFSKRQEWWNEKMFALEQQRGVLLEALRKIGQYTGEGPTYSTPWQDIVADLGQTARAAIKAVEGENT